MSDPRNDQQTHADPTAPTTAQAHGPALDSEAIRAIEERVHNAVFAKLRRGGVLQDAADRPVTKAPKAEQAGDVEDRIAAIQADNVRMRAYDKACAALGLDDEQATMLEALYRAANVQPDQAREWLATTAARLKIGARQPTNPTTSTQPTAPSRSVSDAGAPVPPAGVTEDTPLLRMSPADRQAWADRHGGDAFRKKLRDEMRRTRVEIGR